MAQAFNYADGLRWFGEGVRALRNRPLGLVGIVVFYVLISGLLSGLPVVGTILAGVWMPFGAVLTGFAAREALADRLPGYTPLLAAFRKQGMRLHLIAVGLISAGVLELVMLVFQLLSADQIAQWKMVEGAIDPESVAAHFPSAGVAAALVLYTPLFMATLFAPLLIADAGPGRGQELLLLLLRHPEELLGLPHDGRPPRADDERGSISHRRCGPCRRARRRHDLHHTDHRDPRHDDRSRPASGRCTATSSVRKTSSSVSTESA